MKYNIVGLYKLKRLKVTYSAPLRVIRVPWFLVFGFYTETRELESLVLKRKTPGPINPA